MADFKTTCWTLVMTTTHGTDVARQAALERLCQDYWPPVYSYIRRRGQGEEESKDLTQEFFARLLEKRWLVGADPELGKFRAYLLTMLKRFLAGSYDHDTRQKRGGGALHFRLDWDSIPEIADKADTPEEAFDRRWALTVVHRAMARVHKEAEASGRLILFAALSPFVLTEPEPGAYEQVAAELHLSRSAIAMAVHRLRLRLRELVRSEIAETLINHSAVETEMQELMAALRK